MADSLTISWCPETIILSFFMSFFGAYAGINLCEQSRLTSELNSSRILHHRMPKILIACCIGGVSIWTMHFLGIAAMMLSNPVTGERINKTFTIDYTLISLAAVVVMCYLGILICSRDPVFSIQKVETLDTFIGDTSNMTIGELKNQHFRTKLIYMRLGKGTGSLIIGGLLTGAGICVMHYIGMMAIRVDHYEMVSNPSHITGSVIIAIVNAIFAYWILFRLLALYPKREILRVLSAVVIAIGVCGMHYTGLSGVSFHATDRHINTDYQVSEQTAFFGALLASTLFLFIQLFIVISDLRSWFYRLSKLQHLQDELFDEMMRHKLLTVAVANTFIIKYRSLNGTSFVLDSSIEVGKLRKPTLDIETIGLV